MIALDRSLIRLIATELRVPSEIIYAQVMVESNADPFAFRYEKQFFEAYIRRNPEAKGAKYGPLAACSFGLMQVLLETALEHGFDGNPWDLFVPRISLYYGAKVLSTLLHGWADEDIDRALAAYNGGKVGNHSRPFRTQAYVDRVHAQLA